MKDSATEINFFERAVPQSLFGDLVSEPAAKESESKEVVLEAAGEEVAATLPRRELAPMLKQYVELKQQYPEHVLLFQVGDFYEIFFDDAKIVSAALNIRLTSRDKDQLDPIPMCGVPVHAIDNYLPRLLAAGYSCVMMSQVSESKDSEAKGNKTVRREITRIVTPGVRFEGDGLEQKRFNYLAAIALGSGDIGVIAYLDVSTGHLHLTEVAAADGLIEGLRLVAPSEVILPSTLFDLPLSEPWLRAARSCAREIGARLVTRPFFRSKREETSARILQLLPSGTREKRRPQVEETIAQLAPVGTAAIAALLSYVEEVSFRNVPSLSEFSRENSEQVVLLDAATRRNLEISETRIDGEKRNSLLARLDFCRTAMGSRLLGEWICSPLRDLSAIEARHQAVAELLENCEVLLELRQELAGVRDLDRVISRITSNRATPADLSALGGSLLRFPAVAKWLEQLQAPLLQQLSADFDVLSEVQQKLVFALRDPAPVRINEGEIFNTGYHEELDRLRNLRSNAKEILSALESAERQKTGITGLKIKYNNVFGYFFEISKANLTKVPDYFERKQTLVNAERFVTKELKEQEVAMLSASARQIELERQLFLDLRAEVAEHAGRLQQSSRVLSCLDVLACFAHIAREFNYVRPKMTCAKNLIVKGGRHPVVEQVLGQHNFVGNDSFLDSSARRFAVLTGPNMGGKSTYLRQIGLIQLLAQAGSFVPAQSAELGIVDRIFTRIGGADDLSRGDSTFMVEMREVAVIISKATDSSLVLIDEVGRGTATRDGLAIALAVAEFLHDRVRCRTVFATHFHELTALPQSRNGAFCLCVGVLETGSPGDAQREIVFTHRIEEKAADRSYGIEVARLAGVPEAVLSRAQTVLEGLESEAQTEASGAPQELKAGIQLLPQPTRVEIAAEMMAEITPAQQSVCDRLKSLKVETLTPLQAMNELFELRELL